MASNLNYGTALWGSPFRYNNIADPGRKVYSKTFMADAPVITLQPGVPKLREYPVEWTYNEDDDGEGKYKDKGSKLTFNQIIKSSSHKENMDKRLYIFQNSTDQFLNAFGTLIQVLGTKMGVSTSYKKIIEPFQGSDSSRYISFYCDKNFSLSESVSNDFGESSLSSKYKETSDTVKEFQYLRGIKSGNESDMANLTNFATKFVKVLSGDFSSMLDTALSGIAAGDGFDTGTLTGIAKAGGNLSLPNTWKDSSSSRSFSCTINLISPYGDARSVWEYVYLPFLCLFCLATPRQVGDLGFKSPFIVRADVPGYFSTDLGVISSMSWSKAPDGLFSADGLPLAMTIQLEIRDLYPVLFLSTSTKQFRYNSGLHTMLDNMAGISMEKQTLEEYWDTEIAAKLSTFNTSIARGKAGIDGFLFDVKNTELGFLGNIFSLTKSVTKNAKKQVKKATSKKKTT